MNTAVMFSSLSGEWRTPEGLFKALDEEFHFTLDAAASDENHLCEQYYTVKDDALIQPWPGNVWVNPPYGKEVIKWVMKAFTEVGGIMPLGSSANANVVVMLLPARTDTKWCQLILQHQHHGMPRVVSDVRFLPGRLKFKGAKNSAPFPSMIVVFKRS